MLQNLYLYPIPPFIESVRSATVTTKAPRLATTCHNIPIISLDYAPASAFSFRCWFIHSTIPNNFSIYTVASINSSCKCTSHWRIDRTSSSIVTPYFSLPTSERACIFLHTSSSIALILSPISLGDCCPASHFQIPI